MVTVFLVLKNTPLLVSTGQRITESNNKHAVNNFPAKYSYGKQVGVLLSKLKFTNIELV